MKSIIILALAALAIATPTPQVEDDSTELDLAERFDEAAVEAFDGSFNATEVDAADADFDDEEADFDDAEDADEHTLERRGASKKVGLAADWSSPKSAFKYFKNSHTYAAYNWSPYKFDNLPKGLAFWPMLHGEHSIPDWKHVKKGYAKVAMGMNEVNHPGQQLMSPKRGVELWKKYLQPLKKQGYNLVSASTTQEASGLKWHKEFKKLCKSCHDGLWAHSVHWYGTDANAFKKYVANFHKQMGKPIVVTEFACMDFSNKKKCDAKKAKAFMDSTTSWMNKQSYVKAYFWFGMWPSNAMPGGVNKVNSLINSNSKPNSLGKHYMSR